MKAVYFLFLTSILGLGGMTITNCAGMDRNVASSPPSSSERLGDEEVARLRRQFASATPFTNVDDLQNIKLEKVYYCHGTRAYPSLVDHAFSESSFQMARNNSMHSDLLDLANQVSDARTPTDVPFVLQDGELISSSEADPVAEYVYRASVVRFKREGTVAKLYAELSDYAVVGSLVSAMPAYLANLKSSGADDAIAAGQRQHAVALAYFECEMR